MKRLLTAVLILGALVTLLGLGTWQVQRLAWKQDLIARAESRPDLPAMPIAELLAEAGFEATATGPTFPADFGDQNAYRRVILQGHFVGDPVRVFTTLSASIGDYEGPGFWLMHAFEGDFEVGFADSDIVFVNRGFVPFELPPGVTVREAPTGEVQFEGLIRPDDTVGAFTPDPDYEGRLIYRRSVSQLLQATGIPAALPITIDMPASAIGGLPQAGETKFTFSNRHLEYAITWYGLAACLVGVVGVAWWRRRPDAEGNSE